jgi:hypothetical protein
MYKGVVIKESLKNPGILADFKTLKIQTDEDWHIYWVMADEKALALVQENMAAGPWYAHFANGVRGAVVFKDRIFRVDAADKSTWGAAIGYGISIGIPPEQMDFNFCELA